MEKGDSHPRLQIKQATDIREGPINPSLLYRCMERDHPLILVRNQWPPLPKRLSLPVFTAPADTTETGPPGGQRVSGSYLSSFTTGHYAAARMNQAQRCAIKRALPTTALWTTATPTAPFRRHLWLALPQGAPSVQSLSPPAPPPSARHCDAASPPSWSSVTTPIWVYRASHLRTGHDRSSRPHISALNFQRHIIGLIWRPKCWLRLAVHMLPSITPTPHLHQGGGASSRD